MDLYSVTLIDGGEGPMKRIGDWGLAGIVSVFLLSGCSRTPQSTESTGPLLDEYRPEVVTEDRGRGPGSAGDSYDPIDEQPMVSVATQPLSTFSIDVDTAAYANVRRFLRDGQRPPADAVRIEELVNYFRYDYPLPTGNDGPFAVVMERTECPWNAEHQLVRIGIQAQEIPRNSRPPANLVFLVDVSGSMQGPDRLPLLKHALHQLLDQLNADDRVAVVVYAGASGLALPSTPVSERHAILRAIDQLRAGGSTNGAEGLELAYQVAREHFIEGGVNRIVLATDGDFNVGTTSPGALAELVEQQAKANLFMTILGFGRGNLNDALMEQISNRGNGTYAYIDCAEEARRVLVEQCQSNLVTIAKDVKIQVEFNPVAVDAYRLIGYENRRLADQDFDNDRKDAGDVGAGHQLTVIYEILPRHDGDERLSSVGGLAFQSSRVTNARAEQGELLLLKLRYKEPEEQQSKLLTFFCSHRAIPFRDASQSTRLAVSVAEFGMLLRGSRYANSLDLATIAEHARSRATDEVLADEQAAFQELLELADRLTPFPPRANGG